MERRAHIGEGPESGCIQRSLGRPVTSESAIDNHFLLHRVAQAHRMEYFGHLVLVSILRGASLHFRNLCFHIQR